MTRLLCRPPDIKKMQVNRNARGLPNALDYTKDASVQEAAAEALKEIGAPAVEHLL